MEPKELKEVERLLDLNFPKELRVKKDLQLVHLKKIKDAIEKVLEPTKTKVEISMVLNVICLTAFVGGTSRRVTCQCVVRSDDHDLAAKDPR